MLVRYRGKGTKKYTFKGTKYDIPSGTWTTVNELMLFKALTKYPAVFDTVKFFDLAPFMRIAKHLTFEKQLIRTKHKRTAEALKKIHFVRLQAYKPEVREYIFKITNYGRANLGNWKSVGKQLNILIYRNLGGLGDVLMTIPAIEKVKDHYPTSKITYACPKEFLPLLENNPLVDHLKPWKAKVTQEDYDVVIDLTRDCIKYEMKHQPYVTLNRPEVFLETIGLREGKTPRPKIHLSLNEILWARDFLSKKLAGPKIGIVLTSNAPVRQWPYFRELRKRLLKGVSPKATLLEFAKKKPIDWKVEDRVIPIFGHSLREVAALIDQCDLVISPDTGLAHMACALRRPTIWLFTHIDGKIRTKNYEDAFVCQQKPDDCPKGMPCWYEIPCAKDRPENDRFENMGNPVCATELTVEQVMEKALNVLKRPHVSYLVVYSNGEKYTTQCLERILQNARWNDELILIDNGSIKTGHYEKNPPEGFKGISNFELKANEENEGCIIARNQAIDMARGRFLLTVDSDQMLSPHSTHALMSIEADIIGTEAWSMDKHGYAFDIQDNKGPLAYVGAGGMLARRELIMHLEGFDEVYVPAWFEDPDLCFRAREMGYTISYQPEANIMHLAHRTVNEQTDFDPNEAWTKSHKTFMRRWSHELYHKRIAIVADVPGWAWDNKAQQLKRWLSDVFDLKVYYSSEKGVNVDNGRMIFTFECNHAMFRGIPDNSKYITGVTAHTYKNLKNWEILLERAVAIHANSKMLLEEIKKYNKNFFYVPNGVDHELFDFVERNIKKEFTVGYVGKSLSRKGLDDYIIPACKKAKVDLKIQACKYHDHNKIDHRQMPDFYKDIDVIIIASDMDGTPNQLLEGAAVGRTFIGNRIGNVPEFVDEGCNGFMVDRKINAYVEKLVWLKKHREECQQMGIKARETVMQAWTWKHQSEHYRTLFRKGGSL